MTIVLTFVLGVTYTGLFTVGEPCSIQHLGEGSLRSSVKTLMNSAVATADLDTFL